MTSDPNDPSRAFEYPSLPQSGPPVDPYAPIDYPPTYPSLPPAYPPPYPPQYGPYDPYPFGRPQGTNGQAISALVAAIAGIPLCICAIPSIVAIVLGILAMNDTRRTGQDGHGMALAAVIIGGVTLIFAVVLYIWAEVTPDTGTTS
jgi:hypothetical protein